MLRDKHFRLNFFEEYFDTNFDFSWDHLLRRNPFIGSANGISKIRFAQLYSNNFKTISPVKLFAVTHNENHG